MDVRKVATFARFLLTDDGLKLRGECICQAENRLEEGDDHPRNQMRQIFASLTVGELVRFSGKITANDESPKGYLNKLAAIAQNFADFSKGEYAPCFRGSKYGRIIDALLEIISEG